MSGDEAGTPLYDSLPAALKLDLERLGKWSRTLDNRQRPLQAIVDEGAEVIQILEEGGLRQRQIVLILAAAGIRRKDGTPFPEKSLSSAWRRWRASRTRGVKWDSHQHRVVTEESAGDADRLQTTALYATFPQPSAESGRRLQVPAEPGSDLPAPPRPAVRTESDGTPNLRNRELVTPDEKLLGSGSSPKPTDLDLDDAADLLIRLRSGQR